MKERLEHLRKSLAGLGVQGFLLPVNDEFMGEYIPASAKRLEWLTGFTGSAGMAVILSEEVVVAEERSDDPAAHAGLARRACAIKAGVSVGEGGDELAPLHIRGAAFFTDGRYTLQAQQQVQGYELHNSGELPPGKWLAQHAAPGSVIGYDPKLHTSQAIQRLQALAPQLAFRPVANPVDALWQGRPAAPSGPVRPHPLRFAGEASQDKCRNVAVEVAASGASALLIAAPDSACWLLNIRGDDVPYTPFTLCCALLMADPEKAGNVTLYIDPARVPPEARAALGPHVTVADPESLLADLGLLRGERVLYDTAGGNSWYADLVRESGAHLAEGADPCQMMKACKNPVELAGMRESHARDGLAVTRFLCWLDAAVANGEALTERSVADKLESFRRQSPLFMEPSFATIAGSGPNGAIVHYHATPQSDRALQGDAMLLLDSGGQYPDGTTDITRTIAIGPVTQEMKDRFTRVLKGHIALASAVFPQGTGGAQLDALARQPLWQAGLDYDHGTGHGVGSYLSVHEGPQRISKRGGDVALAEGMILSNEPGYYKTGEYGIRIENLVSVKRWEGGPAEGRRYMCFETLTQAPIDLRLVEDALLADAERAWLREYHAGIYRLYAQALTEQERAWLARATGAAQG